jgi:hypothetical protein
MKTIFVYLLKTFYGPFQATKMLRPFGFWKKDHIAGKSTWQHCLSLIVALHNVFYAFNKHLQDLKTKSDNHSQCCVSGRILSGSGFSKCPDPDPDLFKLYAYFSLDFFSEICSIKLLHEAKCQITWISTKFMALFTPKKLSLDHL